MARRPEVTKAPMRRAVNLRRLTAGLDFRGKVEGQRQTYYVFEGEKFFFICSFSRTKPKAGNFNIVCDERSDRG